MIIDFMMSVPDPLRDAAANGGCAAKTMARSVTASPTMPRKSPGTSYSSKRCRQAGDC
jgi:hypothetical protein